MNDVTQLLNAIDQGDPHAARQLLPLVYEELRKLAAQKLAQEKPWQTLQASSFGHFQTDLLGAAGVANTLFVMSVFSQNLPHGFRGSGEGMATPGQRFRQIGLNETPAPKK